MTISRRHFLQLAGAASVLSLPRISHATTSPSAKRVVIVGGGIAGATAAKYLRRLNPKIEVTLVEPQSTYHSCMMSNEVISQVRDPKTLEFGYDRLSQQGVKVIHDWATNIDPVAHKITLKQGKPLSYDRAIVCPGIDFKWDQLEGYSQEASETLPHAWQAGAQMLLLRTQLEQMKSGGLVIIAPPANPFRCPPGPYERASQIAHYLKTHKPGSKILILDAKNEFAKQALFQQGWDNHYKGMIEWVKGSDGGILERVDVKQREVVSSFESYKADVVNIIPP